jgi:hypothetical protein
MSSVGASLFLESILPASSCKREQVSILVHKFARFASLFTLVLLLLQSGFGESSVACYSLVVTEYVSWVVDFDARLMRSLHIKPPFCYKSAPPDLRRRSTTSRYFVPVVHACWLVAHMRQGKIERPFALREAELLVELGTRIIEHHS